jgi:diaminopimelate decarboxylase
VDHFVYRRHRLYAEDVPLEVIAERVKTPVYVYSAATMERHYRVFADALAGLPATVCYAVKANSNIAVIRTFARLGAGADVVSGGELRAALAAGVPGSRIVYSGIGKTAEEMAAALRAGIMQINVESEPELETLDAVARATGHRARVAIRINPDVDANTHAKISTGRSENKFGIEWTGAHRVYARAAAMPGIAVVGAAVHIGSQLTDLGPYRTAFHRLRDLVAMLRADGHRIDTLDLGGGLGIPYGTENVPVPTPAAYADIVRTTVGDLGCRLILEPGRMLVGNAGVLLTRVLYVKEGSTRTFVIVDAAMNDLMRPALYAAYHGIVPVVEPSERTPLREVDVVGPVCETGDTFATDRPLPPVAAGDLLALRSAGAYGAVMASTYNVRPLVPEVLVSEDRFAVIRPRMNVEELLARERIPGWMREDDEMALAPVGGEP